MLFHTSSFLAFFVLVGVVYWLLPGRRPRLFWLLAASFYFYMSWNPWLVSLILFSCSVDYFAALALQKIETPWKRRALLLGSIATNLSLLGFFKYMNFFLDSVYTVQGWMGLDPSGRFLNLMLPLGISFYTFETISYIVDVYHGKTRPVRDPLEYALYIMFFPHLVAGPIVRPRDFLPQLRRTHRFNADRFQIGLQYFLVGLFKKAVLADHVAAVIDPIFAGPQNYGSSAAWLAALGYSAQIYLDFSGYSDMAVGLAHMLGFRLPANFRQPYLAVNIADFWRRWHISLSSWLRDYLFIPMGGSRGKQMRTCRNLMLTMLLGGLWHGANWTFIVWGALHGLLLVGHRLWRGERQESDSRLGRTASIVLTFLAVCVGWVFFRAQSLGDAGAILGRMFWPTAGLALAPTQVATVLSVLLLVLLGHLLGAGWTVKYYERRVPAPLLGAGLAGLLLLTMVLFPEDGKAFIYFQF